MESFLYQRLVVPPVGISYDKITADAETVIKHYVSGNMISAPDAQRDIPLFRVQPNQNRGVTVNWSSRYKNLGEEIEKILCTQVWEHRCVLNTGTGSLTLMFLKEGTYLRTVTQQPSHILPGFDNIKAQKYHSSDLGISEYRICGRPGEGADRMVEIVEAAPVRTGLKHLLMQGILVIPVI